MVQNIRHRRALSRAAFAEKRACRMIGKVFGDTHPLIDGTDKRRSCPGSRRDAAVFD